MARQSQVDSSNAERFAFDEIGTKLQGYYLGSVVIVIDGRDVNKHIFKTSKGLVSVLGQAHLTDLLTGHAGQMVWIEHTGTRKSKKASRRPMKVFTLDFDPEDVIETGGLGALQAKETEADDDVAPGADDSNWQNDSDGEEESNDVAGEEEPMDETPPARTTRPRAPAKTPDADRAARVNKLLNGGQRAR